MIAVKMGDEDMGDLASADLVIDHLDLRALSAINQVVRPVKGHHLARRVSSEGRNCRVISKDRYSEHVFKVCFLG